MISRVSRRMKEERVKRKSEGNLVNMSCRIEEQRNSEKEKGLQLSKIFEEQERSEAEMRNVGNLDQTLLPVQLKDNGRRNLVFDEDDEDLQKSLQRARKMALQKHDEAAASGPQAIALLAASTTTSQNVCNQNPVPGESQESKVVFTEVEGFVWGLQLDDESHKPDSEDVFIYEKASSDQERKDDNKDVALGKGLSGALQLLKERGTLKGDGGGIEWRGRNMDKKKKIKLGGICYDNIGTKEISIERTDEFGRIVTSKEAFRMISHKFHGKGPGKMKQEKRTKQYQLKQTKNSDTPSPSVARMREAQARLKTPYLVLSGHVKPGQTRDFAAVEKNVPGSPTPMLGNRKVEHFLGIKRKAEPGNTRPLKKPKIRS